MSTTTTSQPPQPTKSPSQLIGQAQNDIDLVEKAAANPQLDTWLRDQFGPQIMAAAATPFGSLLGMVISWLIAHYGLTVDPTLIPVFCGGGILFGHYIQAGIVKAWRWWRARSAVVALVVKPLV